MNKIILVIALISQPLTGSALGHELSRSVVQSRIDGRWEARQTTPRGEIRVTLDLKSEGGNVHGTVTGPGGQPQDIKKGKIDHDRMSFETTALVNGEELTISWSGNFAGDSLDFSRSIVGREQFQFATIQAKRVK